MRKFMTVLAILVLLVLVAAPAMAQERPSIVQYLTDDGRFTTLLAAVEAADLVETLEGDGPFTVLAPTDDAFAALPMGALEFVLSDTDVLTSILTAHVIPDVYYLRDLVTGPTLDSVGGEPITFALADGILTANGAVISSVDKLASNGIVQILDNVIVPAAVGETLAGATAMVRVAHFSPDAGAVDVGVDGTKILEGVEFGTISDWMPVVAGVYTFDVYAAGTDDTARRETMGVEGGTYWTVAARGVAASGDLDLQFISEDYSPIDEGQARVTVFHAIQDAPTVDVLANGGSLIVGLGYPGTLGDNDGVDTVNVAAATYDLQVVVSGSPESVVLDLPGVTLAPNTYYFVAAIGTPSSPSYALAASPAAGE
jgi:uncharacterized surface protein with fasciclin (FAS1) repeats